MNRASVSVIGRLRRGLFGIPAAATRFAERGFSGGTAASRARIELIGQTFVAGYHTALEESRPGPLAARLDVIEAERRGFAYEGAAMALTLLDLLTPWPGDRFDAFLTGPGDAHRYMLHVGAGWALARLPRRVEANLHRYGPLLRWLVLDGYGFHQGYFHWRRSIAAGEPPRGLSGYSVRAFDQGLGRSLWFVHGAEPVPVAARIAGFAATRRADLWGGVGLAAAYAGGVEAADLERLRDLAGAFRQELAQGAAFAAKARERAGNPATHTDLACRILCGCPASVAAAITDQALAQLADTAPSDTPAFERWRRRIQQQFPDGRGDGFRAAAAAASSAASPEGPWSAGIGQPIDDVA